MKKAHTNQSFFLAGDCEDSAYRNVRDDIYFAESRDFVESLWIRYRDLADPTCRTNAQNDFLARFWEMYLAVTLRERGFQLRQDRDKKKGEGPEFYFLHDNRKIWVEAVAPRPGVKEDRVPESSFIEVAEIGRAKVGIEEIPVEKIILRYTGVLFGKDGKKDKYFKAVKKGIIAPDDLYILAINSRRIPSAAHWHSMDIPYFVQAFLPFGNQVLLWNTKTGDIDKTFYERRKNVVKANTESVPTTAFLSPEFSFVSAVLHSAVNCLNHPNILGDDFIILHNPKADHPIDSSLFQWCEQFFFEDGEQGGKLILMPKKESQN